MPNTIRPLPTSSPRLAVQRKPDPSFSLIHDLVITDRESYSLFRSGFKAEDFYRIARGFYLPKSALPEDAPPWQIRKIVALVRHYVHSLRFPHLLMFSHQSALLIRDLPLLRWPLNIHERLDAPRTGTRQPYPALLSGSRTLVPKARTVIHEGQTAGDSIEIVMGMPVSGIRETARDILVYSSPVEAITEVSMLLHHAASYDRRDLDGSRRRLNALRAEWHRAIEQLPSERGKKRALKLLDLCDGKCESIAESKFLWFLHTFGATKWQTQVEFSTPSGIFVADFCFPQIGILIEVDGVTKLGHGENIVRKNVASLLLRDNALTAQGWAVIHLPAALVFASPVELFAHIQQIAPKILSGRPPQRWLLSRYE